jgi:hypothetical protein
VIDCAKCEQRFALGGRDAGQAGDIHPLIAPIGAQNERFAIAVHLPHPHGTVSATARDDAAVDAQCNSPYGRGVPAQRS